MLSQTVVTRTAPARAARGASARRGTALQPRTAASSLRPAHAREQRPQAAGGLSEFAPAVFLQPAQALLASAAACVLLATAPLPAHAEGALLGAELFKGNCAGCHTGGGNIVEPGQTLKQKDLERMGLTDAAAVRDLIYNGKRKMPGYGEGCAPRGQCTFGPRLSDSDIDKLAAYVMEQAAAGWPAP